MSPSLFTPQFIADALILAYAAIELFSRLRIKLPKPADDHGANVVLYGCYALALIALNSMISSPVATAGQVMWMGCVATACGLGARIWSALAACRSGRSPVPPSVRRRGRHLDHLGGLAVWVGATAASGNLIATATVTVAMLAATSVRISDETAESREPRSTRASKGAKALLQLRH